MHITFVQWLSECKTVLFKRLNSKKPQTEKVRQNMFVTFYLKTKNKFIESNGLEVGYIYCFVDKKLLEHYKDNNL